MLPLQLAKVYFRLYMCIEAHIYNPFPTHALLAPPIKTIKTVLSLASPQCTDLCCEATKEAKKELAESESKVFVEEITEEQCHPVVGPATMN